MTLVKPHKIYVPFIRNVTKSALIGLSCVMLTAGCASNMANYNGVELQNRNEVEMVRVPYSIHFGNEVPEMSDPEITKLNRFLATSNVAYGDEFSMDFPLDRNGNLSEIDQKRQQYVSDLLKNSGLYLSANVTPYGMEPSPNTSRLLISKYVVTPPECGDWTQNNYPNYENAPLNNLGCATQANLGRMVANPRDLVIGATGATSDAEQSASAVERYRTRTITVDAATVSGN